MHITQRFGSVSLFGLSVCCAVQARSLLTAHEDFTTLMFTSPTEIQRPGLVFSFLKKHMPSEDTVEEVKRMSLTADGKSAVFDVPSKLAQVLHLHWPTVTHSIHPCCNSRLPCMQLAYTQYCDLTDCQVFSACCVVAAAL